MRPFNEDTTTAHGQYDRVRLQQYLNRQCEECGHPRGFHNARGFCLVCHGLPKTMLSGCVVK